MIQFIMIKCFIIHEINRCNYFQGLNVHKLKGKILKLKINTIYYANDHKNFGFKKGKFNIIIPARINVFLGYFV